MIKRAVGFLATVGITYPMYYFKRWQKKRLMKSLKRKLGSRYISITLDLPEAPEMIVDLEDEGVSLQLLVSKMREHENVMEFIRLLQDNSFDTIVEIGANIGFFVVLEGTYGSFNRLVAVEPVAENIKALRLNLLASGIYNKAQIEKAAIGHVNDTVEITVPKERNLSGFKLIKTEENLKERVPMITLSTLFKRKHIPFENLLLRFDIEGFEYELITGNMETLRRLKDSWVVFELHPHLIGAQKATELLDTLKTLGFELKKVVTTYGFNHYVNNIWEPLGKKCYRWWKSEFIIGEKEEDIDFETLKERIVQNRYFICPHLYLYKP